MNMHLEWLPKGLALESFIPQESSDELRQAFFTLSEAIFSEFNPQSRIPDREVTRRRLLTISPLYTVQRSLLFDPARVPVAFSYISFDTELSPCFEHDRHICQVHIRVARSFRRKRIATSLLRILLDNAESLGKNTIQAEVDNALGKEFCKSLNGEMVHKEVQHRLYMDEADWEAVQTWLSIGRRRSPDTKFIFFKECPDDFIEAFCDAYTQIINQRPAGTMEQTLVTTPSSRRIEEQDMKKRGVEWYTMISLESSGEVSGLTDIMYHPREPHKIVQYFTGVSAKHRRKGLAKRLKAEMLAVIKKQFPDVEYITTTMAPDNRPMLAINAQLGFKSRKTTYMYQWDLGQLKREAEDRLRKPVRRRHTDGQTGFPG